MVFLLSSLGRKHSSQAWHIRLGNIVIAPELTLPLSAFLGQDVITISFAVFIAAGGLAESLRRTAIGF